MFALSRVEVRYAGDGSAPVIRVDDWAAAQGEHWALVGPSGSGKSTLLHVLAGLLRPASGTVVVADQDLCATDASGLDRWRARAVGFVPQRLHLLRSLSALENVLLAPFLAGLDPDRERARGLLGELGLAARLRARPAQLSQGEAQRVAIARAVVNRPRVLLADEPTANLDDEQCAAALATLAGQARAVGATLLIATHDRRVRESIPNVRQVAA